MACHAQIWSYFVQSKKTTTPMSVNHVTKRLAQHSIVLLLNGFDIIWCIFFFFAWFLIASVGQTLLPLQNPTVVFWAIYPCQYIGVRQYQLWGSDPGLDFVQPETWYNKKRGLKKWGWRLGFRNAGWFCRASPTFSLCIYKIPAPNPTTLIGEMIPTVYFPINPPFCLGISSHLWHLFRVERSQEAKRSGSSSAEAGLVVEFQVIKDMKTPVFGWFFWMMDDLRGCLNGDRVNFLQMFSLRSWDHCEVMHRLGAEVITLSGKSREGEGTAHGAPSFQNSEFGLRNDFDVRFQ